jgi:hypothetical protein
LIQQEKPEFAPEEKGFDRQIPCFLLYTRFFGIQKGILELYKIVEQ